MEQTAEIIPWDIFFRIVWAAIPFIGALITSKKVEVDVDSKFVAHLLVWYFAWILGTMAVAYWSEPFTR